MDAIEFEKLVGEALDEIQDGFQALWDNVVIVVEDKARPEHGAEVGIRHHQTLLGLYQGVPQTRRGLNYGMAVPDKITIFKDNIERYARTPDKIRQLVKETVWHEIAHHFGSDERRVRRAEQKRHQR